MKTLLAAVAALALVGCQQSADAPAEDVPAESPAAEATSRDRRQRAIACQTSLMPRQRKSRRAMNTEIHRKPSNSSVSSQV